MSSSGRSHIGQLFTIEEQKRLARDVLELCARHTGLIDVIDRLPDTKMAAVFPTFKYRFIIIISFSILDCRVRLRYCCVPIYIYIPIPFLLIGLVVLPGLESQLKYESECGLERLCRINK